MRQRRSESPERRGVRRVLSLDVRAPHFPFVRRTDPTPAQAARRPRTDCLGFNRMLSHGPDRLTGPVVAYVVASRRGSCPGRTQNPGRSARSPRRLATSRNRSLASGSPMVTRTPSPANGRTLTPAASQAAANATVRRPSRSQTKLPCASGTSQPWSRSAGQDPRRAPRPARRPARAARASAASEAIAAAWAIARPRTAARTCGSPRRPAAARARSRPAARPGRRPWRTCAARRRWRGPREARARRAPVGSRTNSTVGLVDHDQHVARARRPGTRPARRRARPGRWGCSACRPGRALVRSVIAAGIAAQVVPAVRRRAAPARRSRRQTDRDRVRLERPPGVDDLVALAAGRLQQVVEHRRPTRCRRRPARRRRRTASAIASMQRGGAHVGVAVHRRAAALATASRRPAAAGRGSRCSRACTTSAPRPALGGLPALYAGIVSSAVRNRGVVMPSL